MKFLYLTRKSDGAKIIINSDHTVSFTPIMKNRPSEGTYIITHRWAEKDFEVRETVEEIMDQIEDFK